MKPDVWAGVLMGGGGMLTALYTLFTNLRDRKQNVTKQEGEIQLDETTRTKIAAEAAQINSDVAIAQQTWWKESFDAVRVELTEEQRRTRRLTRWAEEHQVWDEGAWERAIKTDPDYPRPPKLGHGDEPS